MDLTPELKAEIDSYNVYTLLERWRFAPVGDPIFQGESGEYWQKRLMEEKNRNHAAFVLVSKQLVR